MTRKIALAYSGGLGASVLLKWLKETVRVPVVAFVADVGQNEDMGALSRKATKAGADRVVLADLRDEFARDFLFPALKADAVHDAATASALTRPLLAKTLIKVAKSEGCDALAHGAAGRGDDQARFELAFAALAPQLEVLAPWRTWELKTRADLLAYAAKHGLEPLGAGPERTAWTDASLLQVRHEGGVLEDPWAEPPASLFRTTADPAKAPDAPATVEVEFADGMPTAVDREPLAPAKLTAKLNEIAGRHGVGRCDVVEDRAVGPKARVVCEAPGGHVLHLAHRAVESLAMDREVRRLRDSLAPTFAALVAGGGWFSPEMNGLRAFVEESQKGVNGAARIRLYKGLTTVVGRKSPNSLLAAASGGLDGGDAGGFVRVQGLRLSLNKSLRKGL